jgi:hypothetical protein
MNDLITLHKSFLDSTKQNIEESAKAIINDVADGNSDPLQVLILAKKALEFFTLIEKNVRPYCDPVGKAGVQMFSAAIIDKKSPDTYDFASCNDSVWSELKHIEADTKLKLKQREAFLKSLTEEVANTTNGEVIKPADVLYGKQTLAITLK